MQQGRSVPAKVIDVVFNGIPLAAFENPDVEKAKSLRENWNVPADALLIGTVTRLREERACGGRPVLEARAVTTNTEAHVRRLARDAEVANQL